jgi:hypothetical protein
MSRNKNPGEPPPDMRRPVLLRGKWTPAAAVIGEDVTPRTRSPEEPKEITESLWNRIAEIRALGEEDRSYDVRAAIILTLQTAGFTEGELIERGILTAEPIFPPNPSALKGARR